MSTLKVAAINNPSASTGGLAISTGGVVTGGGLDYITSSSFSAASAVNVNNCFTSTYANYRVIVNITAASTTLTLQMRLRASAADNSSSNYYFHSHTSDTSSQTTYSYTRSTGLLTYFQLLTNITGEGAVDLGFLGPQLTQRTAINYFTVAQNATDMTQQEGGGIMTVTTAYDGFSLITSTGTITGTLRVYGYRN